MALFTDGTISTTEDLRAYENAIFDLASTEGIDLSIKLVLAQQEMEVELTDFLLQETGQDSLALTARPDLGRVVVTRPVKQWHIFHTLSLAYRDAYGSHFNDRYLGKWKEYARLTRWASTKSFDTGIGMVYEPIPKAPPPTLSAVPGDLAAATYWVSVAWTNAAKEEGCPSDPAVLVLANGSSLVVEAGDPPEIAAGWNVYAGCATGDMLRQNEAPLAGGAAWQTPAGGLQPGAKPGEGQTPDYFVTVRRILQRG